MGDVLVEVRSLGRSFGPKRVLDDVSLVLRAGEVTGFVGANGAGKTTTIQLMLGLLRGEGRTLFFGRPLYDVGSGVAAASALLGTLSCAVTLAVSGAPQPAWGEVGAPAARFVGWMGCWALLCLALVAMLRGRVVPVLLLVLWPLLGERLAGALLGNVPGLGGVSDWLPFAAGRAMLTDVSAYSGDDRPFAQALVGSHLSTPVATAVFFAYVAAVTAAGLWAYCRRDARTG
ncbi:ATP-binding cassette domain-containing protein [Streptomyces sp. NPDC001781]